MEEFVQELPGTSPRTPRESPREVPEISRKRPGNLPRRSILGIIKGYRKTLPKKSREHRGRILENSPVFCGKSQTPCRKKSGEIPGNFLGKLPGSSWQNRGKITGIPGETPGQLLGSSWVSAGFPRFEGYENTRFLLPRRPPGDSKPMKTQGFGSTDTAGRPQKH